MPHAEMMQRMSYTELMHWMILEGLEPFGEMGEYFRNGIACSLLANIHRNKKDKPVTPLDFMPKVKASKKPQTGKEQYNYWMLVKAQADAIERRKRKANAQPSNNPRTRRTPPKTQ